MSSSHIGRKPLALPAWRLVLCLGPVFGSCQTPAPAGRQNIYFVPSNFDGSDKAPCIVPPLLPHLTVGCSTLEQAAVCLANHAQLPSPASPKLLQTLRPAACPELQSQVQTETDKNSRKHLFCPFHIYFTCIPKND